MRNAKLYIKPEARAKYFKIITEAENFFKHADYDPEATLLFRPEATQFFMMDAVMLYQQLTGEGVPVFKVFWSWMLLHYPEVLNEEAKANLKQHRSKMDMIRRNLSKAEFFETAMPITMKCLRD